MCSICIRMAEAMEAVRVSAAGLPVRLGDTFNIISGDYHRRKESSIPDEFRWRQPVAVDEAVRVFVSTRLADLRLGPESSSDDQTTWLHDSLQHQCPPTKVQVVVRLLLLRRTERIDDEWVDSSAVDDLSLQGGDFLVTAVDFGSQAVAILQRDVDECQRCHVQDELYLATRSFFSQLSRSVDWPAGDRPAIFNGTLCRFYADVDGLSSPEWIPFADCLAKFVRPLLSLKGSTKFEPQLMRLHPISQHLPQDVATALKDVRHIRSGLLERLKNCRERIDEMLSDPFTSRILYTREHVRAFSEALSSLSSFIQSPVLRGSGASDRLVAWSTVCRYYSTAPVLDEWVADKRREIDSLKQLLGGVNLKMQTHENLGRQYSGEAFRVFQLKTGQLQDSVIAEILQRIQQHQQLPVFRTYQLGRASANDLTKTKLQLVDFMVKSSKVKDVALLSTSDHLPDGTVLSFNPLGREGPKVEPFAPNLPADKRRSVQILPPRNRSPFVTASSPALKAGGKLSKSPQTELRVASSFIKRSALEQSGQPSIYVLKESNQSERSDRFYFGEETCLQSHRTILMVGPVGSGKSTLVDAMVNYIVGVRWQDPFRFKCATKRSDTCQVTSYTFHHAEGSTVPFSVTLIDTPGYKESDAAFNERLNGNIHSFLTEQAVSQVSAICFVAASADRQATQVHEYFIKLMATLPDRSQDLVRLMVTFADFADPPVVECCRRAGIAMSLDANGKCYYKFNNMATFAGNAAGSEHWEFHRAAWEMAADSARNFFQTLADSNEPSAPNASRQMTLPSMSSVESIVDRILRSQDNAPFKTNPTGRPVDRQRSRWEHLRNNRGPLHAGVACDGCEGRIAGFRYKCLECSNFDLCGQCEVMAKHAEHSMLRISYSTVNRIVRLSARASEPPLEELHFENSRGETHPHVVCDGCFSPVEGFRYKCVDCRDFDLCGRCEAMAEHVGHRMLRISRPLPRTVVYRMISVLKT